MIHPDQLTTEDRKKVFNWKYFNGGHAYGGYQLYYNIGSGWVMYDEIMSRKAKSVLELGCTRGYLLKKLEASGVTCKGFDVSRYAYLTRITDSVCEWDITEVPWPAKDGEFDLCFSDRVLELIPQRHVKKVLGEIARVSRRGLHTINSGVSDPAFKEIRAMDATRDWWTMQMAAADAGSQEVVEASAYYKRESKIEYNTGLLKFNFGCYTDMFHHNWGNTDIIDLKSFAKENMLKFYHHDIRAGIPIRDASATAITNLRVLQQLTPDEAVAFMAECWRILMAGGVIRVSVPDYGKIKQMESKVELGFFDALSADIEKGDQSVKADHLLDKNRKSIYTADQLISMMDKAGFTRIARAKFGQSRSKSIQTETWDTQPDSTVIIEANKLVY